MRVPRFPRALILVVAVGAALALTACPPRRVDTWTRAFGGSGMEYASDLVATSDGGYLLAGMTTSFGAGGSDMHLLKVDGSGGQQWSRVIGGAADENARSILATSDGGYLIAGSTQRPGADDTDMYLVKTDASGVAQWSNTFGGDDDEKADSLALMSDGGYVVVGYTRTFGPGGRNMYVVKTSASGAYEWALEFGGPNDDRARDVVATSDGGCVVVGWIDNSGSTSNDVYAVKINPGAAGLGWISTFGGAESDQAESVIATSDGGYLLAGTTASYGSGGRDMYLIKVNASGTEQWSNTYGGDGDEQAISVVPTRDGGYLLVGETSSLGAGSYDLYAVKTDSSGVQQWASAFGGAGIDCAYEAIATSDGGYLIAGETSSFDASEGINVYVVKTDGDGNGSSAPTF